MIKGDFTFNIIITIAITFLLGGLILGNLFSAEISLALKDLQMDTSSSDNEEAVDDKDSEGIRIAFTSHGPGFDASLDPKYGRADYLVILNPDNMEVKSYDNSDIKNMEGCVGAEYTTERLEELGFDILITGAPPGGSAMRFLRPLDVKIVIGPAGVPLEEIYRMYLNDELQILN